MYKFSGVSHIYGFVYNFIPQVSSGIVIFVVKYSSYQENKHNNKGGNVRCSLMPLF